MTETHTERERERELKKERKKERQTKRETKRCGDLTCKTNIDESRNRIILAGWIQEE